MTALAEQKCEPCEVGGQPLPVEEAEAMAREVPKWGLEDQSIHRQFQFKDFRQAIDFVDKVAELAEEQNHHPDISISYNKVGLTLTTHKIGGLSKNDFILAAKIDRLAPPRA